MTTPKPIQVTPEMRAAVFAEGLTPEAAAALLADGVTPELEAAVQDAQCKTLGHLLDVRVGYDPTDDPDVLTGRPTSDGSHDTELPAVVCRRCPRVWVVLADQPGMSYEDAEDKVGRRLPSGDTMVHRSRAVKERRAARRAERERVDRERAEAEQADRPGGIRPRTHSHPTVLPHGFEHEDTVEGDAHPQ